MEVNEGRKTDIDNGFSAAPVSGARDLGEALTDEFLPYIRLRAGKIKLSGCDRDDLIQEGLIGLLDAASTYSADRGASFHTYAVACIDNRLASMCRRALSRGNLPLADYKPLDDVDCPDTHSTPEEAAVIKSEYSDIIDIRDRYLSKYEKKVLAMHLEGYGYGAIASALGTTPKSADNALQRARRKIKSHLKP